MLSGGTMRKRLCAVSTSKPFSKQVCATCFAVFSLSDNPIISPKPVTPATPSKPLSLARMYALLPCTSSKKSSVMRERMLSAPAQATGLPPNVEP